MMATLSIIFILLYLSAWYLWIKKSNLRLSKRATKLVKYLHYLLLLLTLTAVALHAFCGLDFRGIWTSRLIVIALLITGICFYPLAKKKSSSFIEKVYFIIFSLLPVGVAGLLLVPFLGMIIVLSLWGQLIHPVSKIHYEDANLRIQSSFPGVLGPSQLDIIEKHGVFERSHYQSITHDKHFDSLKVNYDKEAAHVIFKSTNKFVQPEQVVMVNLQE